MPNSPYFSLIQRYFPPDQWETAECIATHECDPTRVSYPFSCVGYEGLIECGHGPVEARSWGIFGILDACWNPAMNPDSPFTPEQWARVLDPNVNTWMASVIWSRGGWRAWTTCGQCHACNVEGGPIPYPREPVGEAPVPPGGMGWGLPILLGLGVLGLLLFRQDQKRP